MAAISPQLPLSHLHRSLSFSANLETHGSSFLLRTTPNTTSLSHPIGCRVTAAQPASDASAATELQGTGAAAPSRGQLFLEHQQAKAAAAAVLKQGKKEQAEKKKRGKSGAGTNTITATACCYGCGAPLQTVEIDAPGYVDLETYEVKKKHHQLRTVLCRRCKLLSHGHMVTAVGGHGGYNGGKQFVSAEELREKLAHLRNEKALIVKLVDIVDFNGSFLARVRDLAGSNPIILVITKIDLLLRETDLNCIGDWVVEASVKKKLNVISVHLTSSKSLVGVAGVISEIQKEKKGRDVYILGAANVGKSAFINAMLKMMAHKDPVAAAARKFKPIQSAIPGTTLGPIQIEAFQGGGKIFDTPGMHLHHRQAAVVPSDDLPYLAPRSRLRGHSFTVETVNDIIAGTKSDMNGVSIFWGGLVRIDIEKVLPQTRLTFYGPKAVQPLAVLFDEADKFYHKELGKSLIPPTGSERVELWPGLQTMRQLKIPFNGSSRPACDIAISGLGWIAVEPVAKAPGTQNLDHSEVSGDLEFNVHVPRGVEIFVRPPLPVGQIGGEWYEYRELSEEEEKLRPKWFF